MSVGALTPSDVDSRAFCHADAGAASSQYALASPLSTRARPERALATAERSAAMSRAGSGNSPRKLVTPRRSVASEEWHSVTSRLDDANPEQREATGARPRATSRHTFIHTRTTSIASRQRRMAEDEVLAIAPRANREAKRNRSNEQALIRPIRC